MDLVVLKSQIKDDKLSGAYIFTGPEIGVMNLYLREVKRPVVRADSVEQVWSKLTVRGLRPDRSVYVVRDDTEFMKNEKLWSALSQVRYGVLVLQYTSIDKRSRFYKAVEDKIVLFDRLSPAQLMRHVLRHPASLNERDAEMLCERCDNDYTQIFLELDKLQRVNKGSKRYSDIIQEIVHRDDSVDIFAFVNNVIAHKTREAVYGACRITDQEESVLGAISLLYNNFRNAAAILSSDQDGKYISDQLGINSSIVTNIRRNFKYTQKSAIEAMIILQDAESGIKQGRYENDGALIIAVCKILNLA